MTPEQELIRNQEKQIDVLIDISNQSIKLMQDMDRHIAILQDQLNHM